MILTIIKELIQKMEPHDDIWQEAIRLSEHIRTDYDEVVSVTLDAISIANRRDTLSALATCLLEHILEWDFSCFSEIERRIITGDDKLLYALSLCARSGTSANPDNSEKWDRLAVENERRLIDIDRLFTADGDN